MDGDFSIVISSQLKLAKIYHENTSENLNSIIWENLETEHTVFLLINTFLWLHIPLSITFNLAILVTFYYCSVLRTPDNFILAGLAASDVLSAVLCIPINAINNYDLEYFRGTKELCILRWVLYIFTTGFNLGIFTLLTVDRYLALRRPFWYLIHITNKTVVVAMLACFVFFLLLISVWIAVFRYDLSNKDLFNRCQYRETSPVWLHTYFALALQFFLMLICLCCTMYVAFTLWKRLKELKNISRKEFEKKTSSAKITIILMFIYLCLYLPTVALFFLRSLRTTDILMSKLIADHVRFVSCWTNAIVYGLSRKKYKEAYKFILTHPPNQWYDVESSIRLAYSLPSTKKSFHKKSEKKPSRSGKEKEETKPDLKNVELFLREAETGECSVESDCRIKE